MPKFILKTCYGVGIEGFDDRKRAIAAAVARRDEFPDCYVVEVVPPPPPVERRIWTDRQSRQATDATVIPMRRAGA